MDVEAATQMGILVLNTPQANSISVAEAYGCIDSWDIQAASYV